MQALWFVMPPAFWVRVTGDRITGVRVTGHRVIGICIPEILVRGVQFRVITSAG